MKVEVYVYSPDITSRFSGLYINYPQVLELLLWQSHLSGEHAAYYSAAVGIMQCQFWFHLVPITAEWTVAVWIQSLPKAFTYSTVEIKL